jgi:hypothetical protein
MEYLNSFLGSREAVMATASLLVAFEDGNKKLHRMSGVFLDETIL